MSTFIQQFKVPIAIIGGFFILGLILSASTLPQPTSQPKEQIEELSQQQVPIEVRNDEIRQSATVTFVVDGDTVEINTGERVRLIGIDASERGEPYYVESRNKLSELVLNKQVRMEKDVSNTDRYSRLLRYLYIGDTFVNLEMVRQGYATAYTYPLDVKYSEQFLSAEQEARSRKVGLWTPALPISSQPSPQPSPQAVPSPSFTVPPCSQTDCNCADFSTHAYAQWFYENYDPSNRHRLDGDRDGIACETLP